MPYIPRPVDMENIDIPECVYAHLNEIAKQIHEVWAKERIEQGWVYGAKRDDSRKTHPCLMPYEQLSEDEKKYDCDTAFAAIKTLLALGYRIEKV